MDARLLCDRNKWTWRGRLPGRAYHVVVLIGIPGGPGPGNAVAEVSRTVRCGILKPVLASNDNRKIGGLVR